MKRDHFIMYIEHKCCQHVRTDKKGYAVYKNPTTGKYSGIPAVIKRRGTYCLICHALGIDPPDVLKDNYDEIVDLKKRIIQKD